MSTHERRGAQPARVALLAAFGVLAVYLLILRTGPGRRLDLYLYFRSTGLPSWIGDPCAELARGRLPVGLALVAVLVGIVRLVGPTRARLDWSRVLLVLLAIPVATGLARVLRTEVFRGSSYEWVGPDGMSYPSTHAAAGAAGALAIALLVGRRSGRRWWLPLVLAVVVLGNVTTAAHMPSDAVGGALVSLAVVAGAAHLAAATRTRRDRLGGG